MIQIAADLRKRSGAMGIRTPDLLHAMRISAHGLGRTESDGEPPTCNNVLKQSWAV
jgi:hypothetical protein